MLETYKELLAEIELHKNLYEVAVTSHNYYAKIIKSGRPTDDYCIDFSGMPKGSRNQMDFGTAITRLWKWKSAIEVELEILKGLEERKKAIDEAIECMDITVKVSKLRAMGLTQEQVAELVDRSTRQIQNIEKKIKENA